MSESRSVNPRYVVALGAAASLILIGGWLLRPTEIPTRPAALPSETELEQLTRRAARRSLDDQVSYFVSVAQDVASVLVRLDAPQRTGVAVDARHVIAPTSGGRPDVRTQTLTTAAGDRPAELLLWGPDLALQLFGNAGPDLTAARRPVGPPQIGDWMLFVWRGRDVGLLPASYGGIAAGQCDGSAIEQVVTNVALTEPMLGAGLFDLEGALLAVVLPCHNRLAAVTIASIDAAVARENRPIERVQTQYGFRADQLSSEEAQHFAVEQGLLVREVWSDYAADRAGLRPGDVIISIAGAAVAVRDDLARMVEANATGLELAVRRTGKAMSIVLPADPLAFGERPVAIREATEPRVVVAGDGSVVRARLSGLGVVPNDQLLRIDGQDITSAEHLRRTLQRRTSPLWLELERGGRHLGFLVPRVSR